MIRRAVALAWLAAVVAAAGARQASGASLDPLLLPVLAEQVAPQALGTAVVGVTPDPSGQTLLSVSLRLAGSADELRALGIRIGGVLGDVATARISLDQLRLLASHPAVLSIEAARALAPKLDVSVPATGLLTGNVPGSLRIPVVDGWSDASLTGRGVLIGIIDSGVDLRHADFLEPNGSTRVRAVWDQSSAVGRPPRGFSYGAECTEAHINERDCPQVDRVGHGTHVAGIAAGNGAATSGTRAPFRYIGMAPEADLLVVKSDSLSTTQVIDALDYLLGKATAWGRPIVVNLSFGTTMGPHDGSDDLDRAVDQFTTLNNTVGAAPGRVVVAAAGNDGQTDQGNPLHAVGCFGTTSVCPAGVTAVSTASPAAVGFVVQAATREVFLDIWYPGSAILGVAVAGPGSCSAGPASLALPQAQVVTASTPCGNILIAAGDTDSRNGDRHTVVRLTHPSQITTGAWSLVLTADSLAAPATRFDLWSATDPADPANAVAFGSFASAGTTIISPASAAGAIAVVSYVTKTTWTSLIPGCCQLPPARGTLNNLSTYASRGPLRPCTHCGILPEKPDLAAPGAMIMSAFSSRIPDDPLLDAQLDPDRRHFAQEGSSMAAAHVTGAAALLLQLNRNLTANQIRAYLLDNVASPIPTPPTQWGRGRLHVRNAVNALRAAGDDTPPAAPSGLRVTSVHSERVALAWDPNPDLDVRLYQIYRRAETESVGVLVREAPATATTFEDRGQNGTLVNETGYFYTIQALDLAGQLSAPSAEVRAVPTAGEGSVGLCFIATAAYGSAWHPHVASLRAFRDRHLKPYALGRAAIAAYETVSPPLARLIARHGALRAATRVALTPVVWAVEHPNAAGTAGLGLLVTAILVLRRRSACFGPPTRL